MEGPATARRTDEEPLGELSDASPSSKSWKRKGFDAKESLSHDENVRYASGKTAATSMAPLVVRVVNALQCLQLYMVQIIQYHRQYVVLACNDMT